VSARKHSPNLCKNDTVVFLERPRSALLMKLLSAATALQLAGYKPPGWSASATSTPRRHSA
jgi:hypothetical protein